jgi:MFS family permease
VKPSQLLSGLRGFVIVWIGQVISLLGTAMSSFGLTIWVYKLTGSATALSLMGFFFVTPMLIISPLAGALVDRSNRKFMMMISDLASGITTIVIFILYVTNTLQIWQLYITSAIMGLFQAFQWPAFSATITTMLPKEQYGRANGLMSLAESGSGILAPVLAGALLALVGLGGILAIDIATFIIAILALLVVVVPQPKATQVGEKSKGSLWKESIYGFHYIWKRPSLLGLQLIFLVGNFLASIAFILTAPMVLSRTGNNVLALGTVNSIAAIGGVVGGVVMSAWGGTRRKVHGVLTGWSLSGLFLSLFGLGRSVPVWSATEFASGAISPWINASNQAIWQAKVAPDVQGRVFSIRGLIAWISMPAAMLVAGPLADYVMDPAMQPDGSLASVFGPLVGVGPGAGIALIILFSGLGMMLVGLCGYLIHAIREAELILPDHDELPAGSPVSSPAD